MPRNNDTYRNARRNRDRIKGGLSRKPNKKDLKYTAPQPVQRPPETAAAARRLQQIQEGRLYVSLKQA